MKTLSTKLAAAALLTLAFASSPALAGKGGSAAKIRDAVNSHSVDAITAEVERAEGLMCEECIQIVTNLTEDSRYEVREVAAWWFAKRPGLQKMMAAQFVEDLATGDSIKTRNAADFLGRTVTYTSLPTFRAAIHREGLSAEAKVAIVRAIKFMGHRDGNPVLQAAMADGDASVRVAAVNAWRDILGQLSAAPVVALLGDRDATVRAEAATVVGGMGEVAGRAQLEVLATTDADPFVRRNAAWALGKLGQRDSRAALTQATTDKSGLVRMVARAALAQLR